MQLTGLARKSSFLRCAPSHTHTQTHARTRGEWMNEQVLSLSSFSFFDFFHFSDINEKKMRRPNKSQKREIKKKKSEPQCLRWEIRFLILFFSVVCLYAYSGGNLARLSSVLTHLDSLSLSLSRNRPRRNLHYRGRGWVLRGCRCEPALYRSPKIKTKKKKNTYTIVSWMLYRLVIFKRKKKKKRKEETISLFKFIYFFLLLLFLFDAINQSG